MVFERRNFWIIQDYYIKFIARLVAYGDRYGVMTDLRTATFPSFLLQDFFATMVIPSLNPSGRKIFTNASFFNMGK